MQGTSAGWRRRVDISFLFYFPIFLLSPHASSIISALNHNCARSLSGRFSRCCENKRQSLKSATICSAVTGGWKIYNEDDEEASDDEDEQDILEDLLEDSWLSNEESRFSDYKNTDEPEDLILPIDAEALIDSWWRAAQMYSDPEDATVESLNAYRQVYTTETNDVKSEKTVELPSSEETTKQSEDKLFYNETDGDGYTYYCYPIIIDDEEIGLTFEDKVIQEAWNVVKCVTVTNVTGNLTDKVRVGDILLQVNDRPILTKTKTQVVQLLSESSRPLKLLFKHELYTTLTFREGRIGLILSPGKGFLNKMVVIGFLDKYKDRIPDHNLEQHKMLVRGDSLIAIQGTAVVDLSFDSAIELLRSELRPLQLTFFVKPFRYPLEQSPYIANIQNPSPLFTDRPIGLGVLRKQRGDYEPGWRGTQVRRLDLLIENGGSFSASWYPLLVYNPQAESQKLLVAGGRGKFRPAPKSLEEGEGSSLQRKMNQDPSLLEVLFKEEDLRVPPISVYFLPSFVARLEVQPKEIRGTISLTTGEMVLMFDSIFEMTLLDNIKSAPVEVKCKLTTEASDGGFVKLSGVIGAGVYVPRLEGARLDYSGRAKLVGRAIIADTTDPLTNLLFFLPTVAMVELPMRLFLPDKGGVPLQKLAPQIDLPELYNEKVNENSTSQVQAKSWWKDPGVAVPVLNNQDSLKPFKEFETARTQYSESANDEMIDFQTAIKILLQKLKEIGLLMPWQ